MSVPYSQPRVYNEIIELFATGSSPERVLAFHPSEQSQARVRELLAKNKTGELSLEEQSELDQYEHIEHLMRLVKARARQYSKR